ncbi:ABC transporter permease [Sediminispirochaeta smaragdinae]|uniref:Binding-protein-dependent transport systems inner membrane component n=1 Tax=Sediminispirochaeta smaragdinae (strain DSM 11293 / JCM 15392 / SEBR 4228) TaxID=573413 RepID=E1R7T7_SEDSS|nr:ABC transporter permease [Sediminispirochaeta smaragdinae]ADK82792.1 binding-protein-dependent transport systems inner membrane component [Sediminispirochaeta smaragdinae DSM 11293]
MKEHETHFGRAAKRLLLPAMVLCAYLIVTLTGWVNPYLIPPPGQIGQAFISMLLDGSLVMHILISLRRVFLGFFLAAGIALPLALLCYFFPLLSEYCSGLLHFLRNTPPLAMVPLLILWFGIGEGSKLALIVLACFFPIFLNTLNGLQQVDHRLLEMGETLELSRKEQTLHILFPEALPSMLTGLRLGFGYSWRALIGAEMIAASSGLGYLILDAELLARTDKVFIGILSIGSLGLLMDYCSMKGLEKAFPWIRGQV